MVNHKIEDCIQNTPIALLKEKNENMAKDINDIKWDVSYIKKDMALIKEFILTLPINFTTKLEFETLKKETIDFKNWINIKIAMVSWWFAVIIFLFNKYL